jgi:hypothetical protein
MDLTNLIEEVRRKKENMLRFFAMEPTAQLEYLGSFRMIMDSEDFWKINMSSASKD